MPHRMPIAEMPNRSQQVLPFQLAQITSDLPGMGWVGDARAVVDGVEVSVTVPLASPATLDPTHAQEERCAVLFEQSVLKLLRTETRWLSDSPLVAGSRSWGAACARVVTERRQRQHAAARKRRPAAPRDCLACHRPSRWDRTTLLPPLCLSICQPGVRSACSTLISITSRCGAPCDPSAFSLRSARHTSAHVGAVFLQSRARANGARVIVEWIGHLPVSNECLLWLLGDMNCAKPDEPWRLFRCFNSEPVYRSS